MFAPMGSRPAMTTMTNPTASADLAPRLAALWQAVAARMADLPVYNPKLTVQTDPFTPPLPLLAI